MSKHKVLKPNGQSTAKTHSAKSPGREPVYSTEGGKVMAEDLIKNLKHNNYLYRIDAAEKLMQMAKTGEDVSWALPSLNEAAEDYSPWVKGAAKKAIIALEESKKSKQIVLYGAKDVCNTDPLVMFNGNVLSLVEALKENQKTRQEAIQKIIAIAQGGVAGRDIITKIAIIVSVKEIFDDKAVMAGLDRYVKSNMERILREFLKEKDLRIRAVANLALDSLNNP